MATSASPAPIEPQPADAASRVRGLLASHTSTEPGDWFLVFKARYGLEETFRALRAVEGEGSVATQTFTCCTAVDPIFEAELVAAYLDVDEDRLALDAASLDDLDEAPLAVMDQHTYGLIAEGPSRELARAAHGRGAILVEDCAHCAGRIARDADGPIADVSVHSFGVEKLLPTTRFGGAVWVNPAMENAAVRERLRSSLAALAPIPPKLERACRSYTNQTRVLNHLPAAVARGLTARLIESGRREPAVADVELKAALALEPMAPGEWVSEQAARDLAALDALLATRRETVAAYAEALADAPGVFVPAVARDAAHPQPLLRFPVFLEGEEAAERARRAIDALGLYGVAWYRPLLFPGVDPVLYGLDGYDGFPTSLRLSQGAVCLPADIGPERAREVAEAVLAVR